MFRMFWKRKRSQRDFNEELESHLALEAEDRKAEGLPDEQAREAARKAFGNITSTNERFYEHGRWTWLENILRDITYAFRSLRASWGFTLGTALLLGLGIGANTAVYSFLEAVMLRSLPVRDPSSLVLLKWQAKVNPPVKRSHSGESHKEADRGTVSSNFPYPFFQFCSSGLGVLQSTFGFFGQGALTVVAGGRADIAPGLFVSGQFFEGLQVVPAEGRLIDAQDERPGAPAVAVISEAYWQSRFGKNSNTIGQTIHVNNLPFQIVGVAPAGFFGVDSSANIQIYFPLQYFESTRNAFTGNPNSMYRDQNYYWVQIMGRLAPGLSMEKAQAALSASFAQWVVTTAAKEEEKSVLPVLYLKEAATGMDYLRAYYSKSLYLLLAFSGLILAIACSNVANLLLARSAARSREIALRLSLGASRARIISHFLTESLILSALGGLMGVAMAFAGMRGLSSLLASWRPDTIFRAELNWNFLLVCAVLAILTGLLFGLAPAITSSRLQPGAVLKDVRIGGPATWLRRMLPRSGLKSALVVAQIAISLLLLAGASLFVHTLSNLESTQVGFNRDNLLIFQVGARQAGYKPDTMEQFFSQSIARLQSIPSVQNVTISSYALVAGSASSTSVTIPGYSSPGEVATAIVWAGPGFFTTMQIPILNGRDFSSRDTSTAQGAVVINEAFAAKYFPNVNPIGQAVRFSRVEDKLSTVVGVCGNTLLHSLKQKAEPILYSAYSQHLIRLSDMTFLLRVSGDPLGAVEPARRVMASIDPKVPPSRFATQKTEIERTIGQERLLSSLSSAFAILALIIASVGLYATMAYGVTRRTGEIGLRMALGAERYQVVALILRESLAIIIAGLVIGLPLVWLSSSLIQSFLYGVEPADPIAISQSIMALLACAMLAAFLPAWRASRVDPQVSLRHE